VLTGPSGRRTSGPKAVDSQVLRPSSAERSARTLSQVTAEHLARRPPDLEPSDRASPLAVALDASLAEIATRPFAGVRRWWVVSKNGGIELHVSWAPHLPAPALRATRVAAGSALLAVRLAVAVSGFRPVTTLLPGGRTRGVLAIVRCGTAAGPTRAERVLFDALVGARRPDVAVPVSLAMPQLRSAVETEGAWLRTVADPADGERLRRLLPADSADTAPGSLLAVLGSHGELPAADLVAGQGLQRLLCTASALGVAADVLVGPVELGERPRTGAGIGLTEQVLVQIGQTGG
jgi:hypothetical protein